MRKKITSLLLMLVATSAVFAQNTPELLYYKFDGTGTSVPNLATNPPAGTTTATILGGVTQGGSAVCGGTLIGSGIASSTDYVNTGWATSLTGMSWTISFRTSNIGSSSTLFYIWGDASAGSLRCFTNGVAGAGNWILRGAFTDVLVNGAASVAPSMTTFVYDMPAGNIKAYLNGVLVNTVTQSGPTIAGTGPFKVCGYSSNVGLPSGGYMDEFRVYSRALTAAEVAELYNPFSTPGFLGADASACSGDSVALSLNWPYGTATWSTGATTDSIFVNTAGSYYVDITGDCGTGSDTVNVALGTTPSPGFLGDDVSFCSGGSVILTAGIPSDTVLWSTGDSTNDISVNTAGSYSVMLSGICGSGSDTIDVIEAFPLSPGFLGSDQGLCTGDTLVLQAGSVGDSILWSTGETTNSISVSSIGSYSVTVDGVCGIQSDTIEIVTSAIVYSNFLLSNSNAPCEGDSVTLSANGAFDTYSWSTSATSPSITVTTAGNYILQVSDACGSGSDTITVSFSPQPTAGFTSTTNQLTGLFTNTSTGGGTYSWNFGDGATSTLANPSHTYPASGSYTVTLTATNACGTSTFSDTVVVSGVGIEQGLDYSVAVYPNPAQSNVTLAAELPGDQHVRVSLLTPMGQVLRYEDLGNISGSLKHNIDLGNLSSGIYIVKFEANEGQMLTRLVLTK